MMRWLVDEPLPSRSRRPGARAADECITKISGIDIIGSQVVRQPTTGLLSEMIADLEARLTEPTAG
ncbi:hypothetical protein [Nonomuraea typhae]|uniref:Uncharacterized protein n=1 Tax=Nonomuraea typhae TaxID=2603600 RepID=A0ABW7YXP4_9ACTN